LKVTEGLFASGHPNIIAKHPTTFEITRESNVTKRGDCIIAANATRGLSELSSQFRNLCRSDDAKITIQFEAAGFTETIEGRGSRHLTLSHALEIVGRRSTYVSDRTLMIRADKAACDLNRDLVDVLRFPTAKIRVEISVEI
jgi:hypothetical protein